MSDLTVEVITRYEKAKPTTYSFDGGKTFLSKQEFKKQIGVKKRPLYSNAKKKAAHPIKHPSKTNDGGRNGASE